MRRLLIAVVILLGLLVVLDRVAVVLANRAVAKQIRSEMELRGDPSVHISGFPFLTQAVRGRYRDVHVQIPAVTSGALRNINVDSRLHGVRAPLRDLAGGTVDRVPVDEISGSVLVHYDDLARASGIPGLTIRPVSGGLQVSAQEQVLGQRIAASGLAHITVRNDDLVVTAQDVQVNGIPAPPALVAEVTRRLSFPVSTGRLPLALRITGVTTGADALSVSAEARDVVLRRGLVAGVT
ncbi:MAG: hypothetical protein V7637_2416 [Mycobacteriales bacterium]|jgi:hypothetical protein